MLEYLKLTLSAALGTRWEYYERTVEYANKLEAIITGEGAEELLRKFSQREDDELFNQRKEFTKVVTPAICNRIRVPYNKALRSDDIQVRFEPADKQFEVTANFYGKRSISQYLESHVVDQIFIDPNAHLIIDFDSFDPNTSKAKPYPKLFNSVDVLIRTETKSGDLDALVVDSGDAIICYTPQGGIKLTRVGESKTAKAINQKDIDKIAVQFESETIISINHGGKQYYSVTYFDPKLNQLHQAKRIGYTLDPVTKCKTCISPIHPAILRLEKTIKTSSELDLTMCLHAYPQKIMQREVCKGFVHGDEHYRCNNGTYYDTTENIEKTCKNCKGSGYEPVHTTAQDVIIVPMAANKADEMNLDNMVKYITVDVDTPKFQNEYLLQLEEQCVKDVFASNTFSIQDKQTATEVTVNYDSVYDALRPFCQQFSAIWEHTAEVKSRILSINPESVLFTFPADLKLKTSGELVEEYKSSEGAPDAVRMRIAQQIIEKAYSGDPVQRNKELTKLRLEPYATKSSEEIQFIIASGGASEAKKHLWANFAAVMYECERKYPDFYEQSESNQVDIVNNVNQALMPKITLTMDEA